MSNNDEWNPTFRTSDGKELERSDWGEWRNGPQRSKDANRVVRIECRSGTRERLRDAKQGQESFDQLLNRLLEQVDQEASNG